MELMRHESIETTMRSYLRKDSARTARIVQDAYRKAQGTVGPEEIKSAAASLNATADSERTY